MPNHQIYWTIRESLRPGNKTLEIKTIQYNTWIRQTHKRNPSQGHLWGHRTHDRNKKVEYRYVQLHIHIYLHTERKKERDRTWGWFFRQALRSSARRPRAIPDIFPLSLSLPFSLYIYVYISPQYSLSSRSSSPVALPFKSRSPVVKSRPEINFPTNGLDGPDCVEYDWSCDQVVLKPLI